MRSAYHRQPTLAAFNAAFPHNLYTPKALFGYDVALDEGRIVWPTTDSVLVGGTVQHEFWVTGTPA